MKIMGKDYTRGEGKAMLEGFPELVPSHANKPVSRHQAVMKTLSLAVVQKEPVRSLGNVPGIAGRSPSYITRQLFDMQHGNRKGPGSELMKAVVANLSVEDMLSIAAYTASRVP